MFRDRLEAGFALAKALDAYKGCSPLVLAIPRGGVPVGRVVADALQGDLDVVLVRKIGAPSNPEFAVASVDETGWVFYNPGTESDRSLMSYVAQEAEVQLALIRERRMMYSEGRPAIDPAGRLVIVVDDGVATGATMIAALHAVRERKPSQLICAVPVSPTETHQKMAAFADEVICLEALGDFGSVGSQYYSFGQVKDSEVMAALNQ